MMRLWLGKHKRSTWDVDGWFKYRFNCDNMVTDYARRAVREIDNCIVFDRNVVVHDVYGGLAPESLSGTCHAVLLVRFNPDLVVDFANVGEKGYYIIADLAREMDIEMCTTMSIGKFFRITGLTGVVIANTGDICNSARDFVNALIRCEDMGDSLTGEVGD